jgi:hypothetical protein
MSKTKAATRKMAGKIKEFTADILGHGRLSEEVKAQQRRAEAERDEAGHSTPWRSLIDLRESPDAAELVLALNFNLC